MADRLPSRMARARARRWRTGCATPSLESPSSACSRQERCLPSRSSSASSTPPTSAATWRRRRLARQLDLPRDPDARLPRDRRVRRARRTRETGIVDRMRRRRRREVELPLLIALVWAAAVGGGLVTSSWPALRPAILDAMGHGCGSGRSRSTASNGSSTATAPRSSSSGASSGPARADPVRRRRVPLPLRRFLPYPAIGALGWVPTFSLVRYGFSETFQSAGRNATRIALVGAFVMERSCLPRRDATAGQWRMRAWSARVKLAG